MVDLTQFTHAFTPETVEKLRTRHLDQVSAQVDALTQLAQEMYDLSLIESGQAPMRMVRASLHDLTDRVMTRLAPQAERAGTVLVNEVKEKAK